MRAGMNKATQTNNNFIKNTFFFKNNGYENSGDRLELGHNDDIFWNVADAEEHPIPECHSIQFHNMYIVYIGCLVCVDFGDNKDVDRRRGGSFVPSFVCCHFALEPADTRIDSTHTHTHTHNHVHASTSSTFLLSIQTTIA